MQLLKFNVFRFAAGSLHERQIGRKWLKSTRSTIPVFPEGLTKSTENLSRESRRLGRDSSRPPPESLKCYRYAQLARGVRSVPQTDEQLLPV
jgi:hypothetical protein